MCSSDLCYRFVANDEADVGYGVFVLWRCVFIHATTDMDPWRNFLGMECADFARDKCTCGFFREKRMRLHRGLSRGSWDAEEACANAAKACASE